LETNLRDRNNIKKNNKKIEEKVIEDKFKDRVLVKRFSTEKEVGKKKIPEKLLDKQGRAQSIRYIYLVISITRTLRSR
jgi:hypothetical protein